MSTQPTPPDADGALIAESSKVFVFIAAVTLLVAGVAGIVNGSETAATEATPAAASHPDDGGHGDGEHPHPGDNAASPVAGAGGHGHAGGAPDLAAAGAASGGDPGHGGHGTTAAAGAGAPSAPADGHGGGDHGEGEATASGHGGDEGGEGSEGSEGSDDHGDHAGAGGDAHAAHGSCADDHPATIDLVNQVRFSLDELYPDVATLVAKGYIPYFDAMIPGGYPPGGEGIQHWLQPHYIDDGVVLDPLRPETVLLDDWWHPVGMMFIGDAGVPGPPVYVNDDGTACSPWHPHTDYPARFGWWFYRMVYDDAASEGEVNLPEETPEMMHVWAVDNPAGVYNAHEYPPRASRNGPPAPMPSYFADSSIEELLTELLGYVPYE